MAEKHESIKFRVLKDWTEKKKGRLFCASQGLAYPAIMTKSGLKPGCNPIWFGPLSRSFKGFPDLYGFQIVGEKPIFCVIEIKTKKDRLRKKQKEVMEQLKKYNVICYIAKEKDNLESGYELEVF